MKVTERSRVQDLEGLPGYDGVLPVQMPPDWRCAGPATYCFVFTSRELSAAETRSYYRVLAGSGLSNPRLITPGAVALASLFHPSFWSAVRRGADSVHVPSQIPSARLVLSPSASVATARYYLQSVLFLSGVTLSAAVVQNRWSRGTIESKFTRLWLAGVMAAAPELADLARLDLQGFVAGHVSALAAPDYALLIELKEVFAAALAAVMDEQPSRCVVISPAELDLAMRTRFGFVDDLRQVLGPDLKAVIAYGSSVTSDSFADYDVLVVVGEPREALARLAGRNPTYRGVELNLGVYGERDFWTWQLASGDNLSRHGLCLYGEVEVPEKPVADLLARNFSFGFIRLRQILGMAAFASLRPLDDAADDKRNLYGYFVKIPMNIAKGTLGGLGRSIDKAVIQDWIREQLDYDLVPLMNLCEAGAAGDALATAAWCTQRVLEMLNREHPVFEVIADLDVVR